jgi:uracil-DNA glycosylase family protein
MTKRPAARARRIEAEPEPVPVPRSLSGLKAEAADCRRCPLYRNATQTVFGEGPARASVMFVGEQPGDQEDLQGRPFVGPAGKLFDKALAEAGIDRARVYVTNGVKHFKNEPRGKRRLHKKPNTSEIDACRWWLDREFALIRPRLTVAMGATAARAVMGRAITISQVRGQLLPLPNGGMAFVTVHPSFLLRMPDPEVRRREYVRFVADLRQIAEQVTNSRRAA